MWQVIGQDKAVNSLRNSLDSGRLSHAYILAGPHHVGKMTLAINLAQALNCQSDEKPCGQCHSCRRIASGNHPDFAVIRRTEASAAEDSAQRKNITIDQIRDVQHSINLKPFEGGYRAIVIDQADQMTEEAANALLKTLEEPPDHTVFMLLTAQEDSLLPTIRSRCRKIPLTPLPTGLIRKALIDQWEIDPQQADRLARFSHGAIGWAISAIKDDRLLEERTEQMNRLIRLPQADITDRFQVAEEWAATFVKNRSRVRDDLELWLTWWRDVLLMKTGAEEFLTNIDRQGSLREQASSAGLQSIRDVIQSIQTAMAQLEQNANPRLTMDVLMLNTNSEKASSHA